VRSAAVLLLALAAWAADAGAAGLRGVWRGTLGDAPIVACFDDATGGEYYYEAHGYSNLLAQDETGPGWIEGAYYADAATGHWTAWHALGPVLAATWTAPDGTRSKPVRLTRLSTIDDKAAHCDAGEVPAYEAPRRARTALARTAVGDLPLRELGSGRAIASGLRGQVVSSFSGALKVLQFDGKDEASQRINAALMAEMERDIASKYGCVVRGEPGEFDSVAIELASLDARWVGVRRSGGGYCGGAHPDTWTNVETFDRHTGDRVDTQSWIVDDEDARNKLAALLFAREFPAEHERQDDECRDAWQPPILGFDAWPVPGGLAIAPWMPHLAVACEDDVFVPRAALEPFLTDAGRAALGPDPAAR
jgi:hypothetical protein